MPTPEAALCSPADITDQKSWELSRHWYLLLNHHLTVMPALAAKARRATLRLSLTHELCHLSFLGNWEMGRDRTEGHQDAEPVLREEPVARRGLRCEMEKTKVQVF